jgi:ribosomal protein L7/L12
MELTYIIIAALIIILPIVLTKLFSGGSRRDTKKVLGAEPRSKPASAPRRAATPTAGDAVRQEVSDLLAQGRKIEAIKVMRDKSGLTLAAAKDAVEVVEKSPGSVPTPAGLVATIRHAQETSEEVQKLVKKGQKIEAIKLIREQTGMGLREAKDLVDRLG